MTAPSLTAASHQADVAEHPEVPAEHALQGFDAVHAFAASPDASRHPTSGSMPGGGTRCLRLLARPPGEEPAPLARPPGVDEFQCLRFRRSKVLQTKPR